MDVRDISTYAANTEQAGVDRMTRLRGGEAAASISSPAEVSTNDTSDLSSAAQSMSQALQAPDVRQDRVADLQQRIASGNYEVQPQDVADAILRDIGH